MTIVIPREWTYNGKSYSLGAEKLELNPSLMGSDPTKNPLFEATLKFIVNPFSSNDYTLIEKNLLHYLNVNLMTNASKEIQSFEYVEEEYREHVTYVWEQIKLLQMGTALEMMRTYIGTEKLETDALKFAIDNLLDKGSSTTLIEFLTRMGFKQVMGMAIKGEEGTALWDAAKREVPFWPALDEIYENKDNMDYVEIKILDEKRKDGSIKKRIIMKIDMESVFEKLMEKAGITMDKKRA